MKSVLPFTVAALALSISCKQPAQEPIRYDIHFQAEDDRGQALASLGIKVGETLLGTTDAEGSLRVQVNAREGERYPLHAPCPANHQPQDLPTEVFFRLTKGLHGDVKNSINVHIVCARFRRVAALLVHADGYEDMPIFIDGVPQGRTGSEGFSHLRLERQPGAQFEVALDSSAHPGLVPANPSQTMTIGEDDGLFVFDPVFREAVPEKKPRRRRSRHKAAPPPPVSKRPVRID